MIRTHEPLKHQNISHNELKWDLQLTLDFCYNSLLLEESLVAQEILLEIMVHGKQYLPILINCPDYSIFLARRYEYMRKNATTAPKIIPDVVNQKANCNSNKDVMAQQF